MKSARNKAILTRNKGTVTHNSRFSFKKRRKATQLERNRARRRQQAVYTPSRHDFTPIEKKIRRGMVEAAKELGLVCL